MFDFPIDSTINSEVKLIIIMLVIRSIAKVYEMRNSVICTSFAQLLREDEKGGEIKIHKKQNKQESREPQVKKN